MLNLCAFRSTEASWHADYRDTAYIYIGGLPFDLSEGDIITIFSQYGEPVHVNLVRDKETGKSKGFAFLKYEDQRSTDLAVDNLGGASVLGRILKVDHTRYKSKDDGENIDNAKDVSSLEARREGDGSESERSPKERKRETMESMRGRRSVRDTGGDLTYNQRDHDNEDPMKEYILRQKALEARELSHRAERPTCYRDGRSSHHGRHHHHDHHHRRRRQDSDEETKHQQSSGVGPHHQSISRDGGFVPDSDTNQQRRVIP